MEKIIIGKMEEKITEKFTDPVTDKTGTVSVPSRRIIHIYNEINRILAKHLVNSVIEMGLISKTAAGRQYCFVTTFEEEIVTCYRNAKSFRFNVYRK